MPEKLLQQHGLKVTKQRLALLSCLRRQRQPLTVERLRRQVSGIKLPALYRMLEDFLGAGLANRVDLGHGHTHYEYNDPKRHHHHMVCEKCGRIQDIVIPPGERLLRGLAARYHFLIRRHAMEFFGLCRACQFIKPI